MKVMLIILVIFPFGVNAEIYKCTSESGAVTFTDRPCNGGPEIIEQDEITQISEESAKFYEISPESEVDITLEMHNLLYLKHIARTAQDICDRRGVLENHEMMRVSSDWENHHKVKLDEINDLLNSGDSMAYQLKLVGIMNSYENELKAKSNIQKTKVCKELIGEMKRGMVK